MQHVSHRKTNALKFLLILFPFMMIGLAIFGGIYSYSPVPVADEWRGNIGFNQHLLSGDHSLWWAQHNEHRILWSRILFWVDALWFGGIKLLLIPLNYLFMVLSSFIFWRGLRTITVTKKVTIAECFVGALISAWLFSWSQNENLIWGFQSQFFLAQLLPLLAFYFLIKSIMEKRYRGNFILACVFGVAASGTMANGVFALPLMLFYMLIMRQKLVPTSIIALLATATLSLYLYNYHAPSYHGSLLDELKNHPLALATYILFYLGNPFYYLFELTGGAAKYFAFSAGLFLLGSTTYFFIKFILRAPKVAPEHIFLFFILFVMITACVTAGGRLSFGTGQAFSSRYVTPVLMAWASLVMLYARSLIVLLSAKNKRCILLLLTFMVLMTSMQLNALKIPFTNTAFNQDVAGLALSLQINDRQAVFNLHPRPEYILATARLALQQRASFFGIYPYRDIEQKMGGSVPIFTGPSCQGNIDVIEPIETDPNFLRIRGWLFNPAHANTPKLIQFVNDKNKIVGYALSGALREDVAKAVNAQAIKSGFSGYIRSQYSGGPIVLQGEKSACTLKMVLPPLLSLVEKQTI